MTFVFSLLPRAIPRYARAVQAVAIWRNRRGELHKGGDVSRDIGLECMSTAAPLPDRLTEKDEGKEDERVCVCRTELRKLRCLLPLLLDSLSLSRSSSLYSHCLRRRHSYLSPPSSASPRRPPPTVEEGQKQPFIESFIIDVDSRAAAACVPDLTHWPMADSQMHLIACPFSCTYMYNLGIRFLIGMILTSRKKEERGERDSNAHSAFVFNLTE